MESGSRVSRSGLTLSAAMSSQAARKTTSRADTRVGTPVHGRSQPQEDATAPPQAEAEPAGVREILDRANRIARIGFWEIDFVRSRTTWSAVTREIHELPSNVEPGPTSAIDFHRQRAGRERMRAAMAAAIAQGEPYDLELQITTGRGEARWIRTIGVADMVDGRCRRLYGTVQDNDARVKAEEARLGQVRAEAAYSLKSHFLSEMSQELRIPLNAVLGFAQLLADDAEEPPSPRQKTRILHIERAGTQLVNLIDDVMSPPARDRG
jgi:signal transduction histidine kinase